MARTFMLNDLELILLSSADQRDDCSLLPPPDTIADQGARIRKSIATLQRHNLVDEVAVTVESQLWRRDGDTMLGLIVNDAGRHMIGAPVQLIAGHPELLTEVTTETEGSAPDPSAPPLRLGTRTAIVMNLLARESGATLAELVAATGWLPHSTRAALTGLRKKGQNIIRYKRDDFTCYAIRRAA